MSDQKRTFPIKFAFSLYEKRIMGGRGQKLQNLSEQYNICIFIGAFSDVMPLHITNGEHQLT